MEDAGTGLLRQKFEQLKDRLALEGLFSHSNKKRIPKSINRIGIITSPTGAAIKDILSVLQRRNPSIEVFVYPTLVQGAMAAKQICQAINIANQRQECDLLLISRGGGSLEDLWCFNEELVVRTIFASKLAIISAIGHEVDTTLTDYVADLRAPTPSAGAELVSQDKVELKNALEQLQQRLNINFVHRQQAHKQKLFSLKHRLQQVHPEQKLQLQQQKNDELKIRLTQAINRKLNVYQQQPLHLTEQLMLISPSKNITLLQQRTSQYKHRLSTAIKHNIAQQRYKFMNLIEQLQLVSPLATMARGYSITRNDQRKVIRNTMQVEVGENITIQLSHGEIKAKVLKLK